MTFDNLSDEFQFYHYVNDETWREEVSTFQLTQSKEITENPKVSVIIANYNNAPYLDRMMNSLVTQTLGIEQIQVMFIDDCSTDNSVEVIRPYIERYPNIELYLLDKNTGGAHGPRNVGITQARGEYVVFLDADDWYEQNAFRYLTELMDKTGDAFAVSGLVQHVDGHLSLKSPAYYVDGEFHNRSIHDLPAEFYGWLGPQAIMLKRSLIVDNHLHFVDQRVADDVLFFYQAMRHAQTITQGVELTTYLNRDSDNVSLSRSINKTFLTSWLRALAFINQEFPDDVSKERFMGRRIDWLVYDFCLRRDIGWKFNKERLREVQSLFANYLGSFTLDLAQYFRSDARQISWGYLANNEVNKLYKFIWTQRVRWILYNKFHMKKIENGLYYYPTVLKSVPRVRVNGWVVAEKFEKATNKLTVNVASHHKVKTFEARYPKAPFEKRTPLLFEQLSETKFVVTLPEEYDDENWRFVVLFENYLIEGARGFAEVFLGK
ncbi:Glycosyl transferase family 2 [Pilibacter termitis]|uniref:Glycosyl transferase family 2 n=1 Tax=Pilibacter termitis TaxID=263852 RepID=A0A1T4R028_9ENTE|nr:glycosyltransferase family A protein [Pilibacter termitis]SKA09236.1 Glycosyl transferase family 2 [Pilibacter termitis]